LYLRQIACQLIEPYSVNPIRIVVLELLDQRLGVCKGSVRYTNFRDTSIEQRLDNAPTCTAGAQNQSIQATKRSAVTQLNITHHAYTVRVVANNVTALQGKRIHRTSRCSQRVQPIRECVGIALKRNRDVQTDSALPKKSSSTGSKVTPIE
jgi:hypothetical protein